MKPDVIVIGAGPSGCAAALTAARGGAQVLIVEKSRFPRDKACGDGLTPRAVAKLVGLGIQIAPEPRIDAVRAISWSNFANRAELAFRGPPGTVIERLHLDSRIAQAAVHAGATLRSSSTAEALLIEDGVVRGARLRGASGWVETLRAHTTILAEGSVGALSRQVPLPRVEGRQLAFAARRYFENVEWDAARHFEIYLPIEAAGVPLAGYAWVFPLREGLVNVGLGFFTDPLSRARLPDLLVAFEESLLRHDPRFSHAHRMGRVTGAPILVGGSGRSSHAPGLLLVGDAAGLPNPLWAEGIAQALGSGELAGSVALEFLAGRAPLSAYGRALAERDPTYDRIASSLPLLYRSGIHTARDLIPFLRTGTTISRAFFGMVKAEVDANSPRPEPRLSSVELTRIARSAVRRARQLASRDRAFFGEMIDQIERLPDALPSVAPTFLIARAQFPGLDTGSIALRRLAVALELVRLAACTLDDLGDLANADSNAGERGGGWLSAAAGLNLGDRILARAVAVASRMDKRTREIFAEAMVGVFAALTADAVDGLGHSRLKLAQLLSGAAARAGARMGGARADLAEQLARVASELLVHSVREESLEQFEVRVRVLVGDSRRHVEALVP